MKRKVLLDSDTVRALQGRQRAFVYGEWYGGKRTAESVHAQLVQLVGAAALSLDDVRKEWAFLDAGARRATAAQESAEQLRLDVLS